ncbi:unnamed protein product [Euphydryas editha]|uniref:C2H2-type domain-containing protein n=1 Tax=Euphydryas editha TaxID=104508 RepID=A0AAU9V1W8_EUPED|nr:unnamed protein product [Euphydryas editha]
MNSKNLKKNKEDKFFSNLSNDNPEVLVLPPNLLEKLGINLGNIQPDINSINTSSTETLDYIVQTPPSKKSNIASEKPYMNNCSTETSILKTADLMKESVLLSPTFSTLKPYEILNEADNNYLITSEKSIEDNQIVCNDPTLVQNGHLRLHTEHTKEYPHTDSLDVMEAANEKINNNCVKLTQDRIRDTISNTNFETETLEPNCKNNKSPDTLVSSENCEHLSDKSTKNINQNHTSKPNNKINILSQEILDTERIKQLKIFNSPETRILIPMKIDTTLSKNNKNITERKNLKKLESQSLLNKEQKNTLKGINMNDNVQCVNKNLVSIKRGNESPNTWHNSSDNLVNISDSKDDLSSIDVKQTNNLSHNDKKNEECSEKLTIFQTQQRNDHFEDELINNNTFSTPVKSSLDSMKNINDINKSSNIDHGCDSKEKKFNSEENIVTSKLCIQGVEKPGGELEIFTKKRNKLPNIKTYKSKKLKSCNPKITTKLWENSLENIVGIDYKLNEPKANIQNFPKFCICKDFGSFENFESDELKSSYEHVHFLNRMKIHCSLYELFSIYENKCSTIEEEENDKYFQNLDGHFEEVVITNEPFDNNTCWHHIESIHKNSDLDNNVSSNNELNQYEIIEQVESLKNICLGNNDNRLQTKTVKNVDKGNFTEENIQCEKVSKNDAPSKVSSKGNDCIKLETSVEVHHLRKVEGYDSCKNILLQQESNENGPKKRKRCSISESNDDKSSKKQVTETIRCETCGNRVAKIDWEDHISKKHCFIAWKEGETICSSKKYDNPSRRKKRNIEIDQSSSQSIILLTCGVCQNEVEENLWFEHIGKEHNYLAWEQGSQPLDFTDEEKVLNFLKITRRTIGPLECSHCGVKRTRVASYINHLKNCANIEILSPTSKIYTENENQSEAVSLSKPIKRKSLSKPQQSEIECEHVICGVCHIKVKNEKWIDHICKEHAYLAWKEGDEKLDVNDPQEVNEHLYNLSKDIDGLVCAKCGIRRKYVKSFLTHIRKCTGLSTSLDSTFEVTLNDSSILNINDSTASVDEGDGEKIIKCGVCHKDLEQKYWLNHIQKEHAYMAWKEGQPALNLDDKQEVMQHLNEMNKKYNGLVCNKCGITRKYIKVYLSHIESCESTFASSTPLKEERITGKDSYECAVCSEVVEPKNWKSHAMKKHYNIAWAVGDFPIDLKNPIAVENYLKEYKKYNKKLECFLCGTSRVSPIGFYAHIIQCGKSEKEIEEYKNHCDICNTKYLCIYKNQHIQLHREQEYAKERKKLLEESKMKLEAIRQNESLSDGRLAAKRARNFIGKYQKFEYNCPLCGFGTDDENVLEKHECGKKEYKDYSDSEESADINSSSDESDNSEIDSSSSSVLDSDFTKDIIRKHSGESKSFATRIKRIPFEIKNPKDYLSQSAEEFRKIHYTNETLYPQWRDCKYKIIPDEEISKYMPPLNESCKLLFSHADWKTINKFQAAKINGGYTVFVGSSIQSVSWATGASRSGHERNEVDEGERHFLAVSCHNDTDSPRLDSSQTYSHANMLQIWDFGDFTTPLPKFVLGIAHEYGTVWSIDWCPSGSRDLENSKTIQRLGLLSAACSNGSAYIFSIPYPATITDSDKIIYNLTPVAELRLCRGERRKFQATSTSWSPQRGHSVVVVGYSDGTTALFDLQTDSPLLKETEDGINIFYPYHDERSHNVTITGVSALAGGHAGRAGRAAREGRGVCAASSAAPTGAESARRGAAPVRLRSHLPGSAVVHSPLWPSALIAENDGIVTQAVNELDWWGWGQRLGAVHACGACAYCGALAAFAPPLLRLMTPHPAHSSLHKQPVAFINMKSLSKKRTKQKIDELAIKLEPRTYEDAIKSYGIEFKLIKELDKNQLVQINNKPKEHCHGRFPLNDVPSMAFNPSPKHHRKLAVATHAGVIFVISV